MIAAVVRAPDGVRFVTKGQCADEVAAALVNYVRGRCDDVLWPHTAPRVRALIEARQYSAAIRAYFEHVGSRWDEEWLEIHVVTPSRFAIPNGAQERACPGDELAREQSLPRYGALSRRSPGTRVSYGNRSRQYG